MNAALTFTVAATGAAYPGFAWAIFEKGSAGRTVICESLDSFPTRFAALFEGQRVLQEMVAELGVGSD